MQYTYLLINLCSVFIPFAFSFDGRLNFYKKWTNLFPAIAITAFLFIVWDYYKTLHGVWSFNDKYLTGIKVGILPIEEMLFFLTIPYACMFVYESVSYYASQAISINLLRAILTILSVVSVVMAVIYHDRIYTLSVMLLFPVYAFMIVKLLTHSQLSLFVITYLISLIPMAIVNGLLTSLPVVIYNNMENTGVRIGTMPIEDFVYCFLLLASNTVLYEKFRFKDRYTL